jgi:hypothetical protein
MHGDFKGDFSRIRFDPAKQYTAVVKQQGRVDLDSDDFEQHAIDQKLRQNINTDVIGQYGGPASDAGFQISITNSPRYGYVISISPGRYYVQGILVENQELVSYEGQPYLIESADAASALLAQLQAGKISSFGLVLQVWQRLVTALDDPSLLEPALGHADTTVRLQTVWQVIAIPPPSSGDGTQGPISQLPPVCQALYSAPQGASTLAHTGTMSASLAQPGSECGCQPIAAGGYQGLENQLYRVEIHRGGPLSSATFKWSRENASVVVAVNAVNGAIVTVASLGPDANLGFQAGQWVELSDDSNLFGPMPNQPGNLYQIQSVNPATLQVTMTVSVTSPIDPTKCARMRRWEQTGASATPSGIPVSTTPIALENGILVTFGGGEFQPGDYWTIPARTNGLIDWPPNGANESSFQLPSYVHVYQAPVACVSLQQPPSGGVPQPSATDCRLKFPPLMTVNNVTPPALHVFAYSWPNDDVMTVDTLLQQGLSITFDQAPTCPWSGANFQVVLEAPAQAPIGSGTAVRTAYALDPPFGITVSGNQVVWLPQLPADPGLGGLAVWSILNNLLNYNNNPAGSGRVRIRLDGGAVYSTGSSGTAYLDGQTFGSTATRASDGTPCINLSTPSGNAVKASDFEGWFYLAPTLLIQSVVIQGVTGPNQNITISQVTVTVTTETFL